MDLASFASIRAFAKGWVVRKKSASLSYDLLEKWFWIELKGGKIDGQIYKISLWKFVYDFWSQDEKVIKFDLKMINLNLIWRTLKL